MQLGLEQVKASVTLFIPVLPLMSEYPPSISRENVMVPLCCFLVFIATRWCQSKVVYAVHGDVCWSWKFPRSRFQRRKKCRATISPLWSGKEQYALILSGVSLTKWAAFRCSANNIRSMITYKGLTPALGPRTPVITENVLADSSVKPQIPSDANFHAVFWQQNPELLPRV